MGCSMKGKNLSHHRFLDQQVNRTENTARARLIAAFAFLSLCPSSSPWPHLLPYGERGVLKRGLRHLEQHIQDRVHLLPTTVFRVWKRTCLWARLTLETVSKGVCQHTKDLIKVKVAMREKPFDTPAQSLHSQLKSVLEGGSHRPGYCWVAHRWLSG